MIKIVISFILLFVIFGSVFSQENSEEDYGQKKTGLNAEPFTISDFFKDENNKKRSFGFAYSPDGKEMFFSFIKKTPEKPEPAYEIKTFKRNNNIWIGPETADFSGVFSDFDICFSPNGESVFFASDRPDSSSAGGGIYYMNKTDSGWSKPIFTGSEVNVKFEAWPSVSTKGNLFFQSHRPGGYGLIDIYRAEWFNGKFINVKNLGPNINTELNEYHPSIAPDESYILISTKRPIDGDISQVYISFQIGDNIWTKAKRVGPEINTDLLRSPTFSPDGKYIFFNKKDGIYRISTKFVEELKPLELLKNK